MKFTWVRLAIGVAVVFAALLASTGLASAISWSQANVGYGKCWQNSAGNCYHWARQTPGLTLKVENDVSTGWQTYYGQALTDWTFTVNSVSLVMNGQNATNPSPNCAGISGIARMCSRKYGFNGWLGLASIWVAPDGEHITAGTVKLNDSYFDTATYNTQAWRNLVSCQELAHTLGLNHEDEVFTNPNLGSCMDYTNNPGTNQFPSSDDKATLANMYAGVDTTNTVAAGAPTSRGNGNGQGLGQDEDALPPGAGPHMGDTFVKRLPNGLTLITHVFWVQPGNVR